MFTFKSVGHFFAKSFKAIATGAAAAEKAAPVIETVTSLIPGGAALVPLEDAGFMALGELGAVISKGDAAVKAKLADAGLDKAVIEQIEGLVKSYPQILAIAKSLKT